MIECEGMKAYKVDVRLSKQEDGLWRAEVPALPGCFVDGPTMSGVLSDIQEVAALAIDFFREKGSLPAAITLANPIGMSVAIPVLVDEHEPRHAKPQRGKVRIRA
jgi:predicted RNase H-like HicB family nuclease